MRIFKSHLAQRDGCGTISRIFTHRPDNSTGSFLSHKTVLCFGRAEVAELVDAHGSGPCLLREVEVQVLSSAPIKVRLSAEAIA